MKIIKILSVGLIAFLGMPGGKAADDSKIAGSEFTAANKLSSFIKTTGTYIEDLQKCADTRQQAGAHNNVGTLLSSYPELQPGERGFSPNFNAAAGFDIVKRIQDTERTIQQLIEQLKRSNKELEEIYSSHVLPTTFTSPVQKMNHPVSPVVEKITPYIPYNPGGTPTTGVILEEERKTNSMRALTSADVVKFRDECEVFRQECLAFAQDANFDHAAGGLKSKFCFFTMNGYLQDFMKILESAKQSPTLAGNAVAKIFYEKAQNKNDSENFKEGLLGFIKVINENQESAFLELFNLNMRQEFLDVSKTIKDYVKEHEA